MATFRVEKNRDYTVMSNHHLRNSDLSLKAKGLLSQMLSLPDEWDFTLTGLAAINKESKDAIRSAVQELEQAGYIQRRQTTDAGGKFSSNEYVIYEQPVQREPLSENPTTDNPSTENPSPENPTQLNKDISSKDISEKKNRKEKPAKGALTDEQLREAAVAWADATFGPAISDSKIILLGSLELFYAPRSSKKETPARTPAAFTALTNRLVRHSGGNINVMIDMLDRATAAGWKSVFPLSGERGGSPPPQSRRDEEWL